MIKNLQKLRNSGSEEGFTLIELMIVVVIIGILAAIAIPIFANQQKSAADAALKSDLKNTALAVETYFTKNPTKGNLVNENGAISGWALVKTSSPTEVFVGTKDKVGQEIAPVGFNPINVSNGTALGIVSQGTYEFKAYCIVGVNSGSNYVVNGTDNSNPLFYDSKYGITEKSNIKADGACKNYVSKVW